MTTPTTLLDLAARCVDRAGTLKPPYYAETASVKGDENWPNWIIRNKQCSVLGASFMPREVAEMLAPLMNQIAAQRSRASLQDTEGTEAGRGEG